MTTADINLTPNAESWYIRLANDAINDRGDMISDGEKLSLKKYAAFLDDPPTLTIDDISLDDRHTVHGFYQGAQFKADWNQTIKTPPEKVDTVGVFHKVANFFEDEKTKAEKAAKTLGIIALLLMVGVGVLIYHAISKDTVKVRLPV